jgi:hypothetical protein
MVGARTRLLTRKENGPHLHAGRAEGEGGNDTPGVSDASGGCHRQLHGVYDLRHEGDGAGERLFRRP